MRRPSPLALLLGFALLAACAAPRQSPQDRELIAELEREAEPELIDPGPGGAPQDVALRVSATDVTTEGRRARVRGRITNPFHEPVYGIRYLITIVATSGEEVRELESIQKQVDTAVDPGDSAIMRLDLDSMYFASTPTQMLIGAFPVRIGRREIAPPPGWKE